MNAFQVSSRTLLRPISLLLVNTPPSATLSLGGIRCFSKYISKSALKRLPLTTKRAKKGFVKGKGCNSEGRNTSKGYKIDPKKKLRLIIPDLTGFTLKPYIAASVPKVPPERRNVA